LIETPNGAHPGLVPVQPRSARGLLKKFKNQVLNLLTKLYKEEKK
jgi:hypothetical protein